MIKYREILRLHAQKLSQHAHCFELCLFKEHRGRRSKARINEKGILAILKCLEY